MKAKFKITSIALALIASILQTAAQGTAFTYQGRLNNTNGIPASGSYDFQFGLWSAASGPAQLGSTLTSIATPVTNGLFLVTVDFGSQLPGADRWLEISLRTNGGGGYGVLSPRQKLTPTPYAITAGNAVTATTATTATSAATANNFSGALAGDVTGPQIATVVATVGGQMAANVASGVIAANAATSANTASTIVQRDASGNFANNSLTLNGNLYLPATTASAGTIYLSGQPMLQGFGGNTFVGQSAGNLTTTGGGNTANGSQALHANTSGQQNTAAGYFALYSNTSGNYNVANGVEALFYNTTGNYNTAGGFGALYNNTNGQFNTANGFQAAFYKRTGNNNTAEGYFALENNIAGSGNIALGANAGQNITNGNNNIVIGNSGAAADDSIIRIGTTGTQTNTFVAGIYGVAVANGAVVSVNASGQLGTGGSIPLTQLPAAVLTNTATGVTLAGTFNGAFSGNGANMTNVNAASLNGLNATNFWQTGGNAGTTAGVNFVGTTDNQPLEMKANSQQALRLEPNLPAGAPNFIAGSYVNYVVPGKVGAAIGGGGATNYLQAEPALSGFYYISSNQVASDFGTIGGGGNNLIQSNSTLATIGGGAFNTIQTNSRNSTIGGGLFNTIQTNGAFSAIGGGLANVVSGAGDFIGGGGYDSLIGLYGGNTILSDASVIGGGYGNQVVTGDFSIIGGGIGNIVGFNSGVYSANNFGSTIGGGENNTNTGEFATIPGGYQNYAQGYSSFAAGQNAKAMHDGTFVWADDSTTAPFASTAANQFLVRAGFTGINRATRITGSEYFGIRTPVTNGYGGMYVETAGVGQPFYGYAMAGGAYAWTYVDGNDANKWKLSYGLTVTSGGNVGIGTAAPDATLSVNGSADKPGGGSWSTFSDGRLKDVGAEFTHGLEDLERIQPVHYHYKADNPLKLPSQPEYVGVVAQDVQQVIPEAVDKNKDGYLTVNNDPIIWTMFNAIKELNQKVDAKNVENAELKVRLEKLEQLLDAKSGGGK